MHYNTRMRFSRRKKKIFLIIFFVLSFILLLSNIFFDLSFLKDSVSIICVPIEKFFSMSANWSRSRLDVIINISRVAKENLELKNQIEIYKLKDQEYKIIASENKKLRDIINLSEQHENYKTIGARVIAKDINNWFDIFVIDKGLRDGIKNNMPVISNGGLVGKIIESRNNFSKVSSLIDDKSSVSIKNFRTNDLGFAKGNLKLKLDGLCSVEFLDLNSEIIIGDEIITSHLSEIFPEGLLLGHVQKIIYANNIKTAVLKPDVNFKNLEYVLIITQVFDKKNFLTEE